MDTQKILTQQFVRLHSHRGEIDRLVIEDLGGVIAICRPEEAVAAQKEGRKPRVAHFKKADIVRVLGP